MQLDANKPDIDFSKTMSVERYYLYTEAGYNVSSLFQSLRLNITERDMEKEHQKQVQRRKSKEMNGDKPGRHKHKSQDM